MKIQIDLDPELWNRFRDVVIAKGQTLKEVVPTVFEPALRWYLHDPPLTTQPATEETKQTIIEASNKGFPLLPDSNGSAYEESVKRIIQPPIPTVKRCDLCDQVVDRLFASAGKRVCYTCWKGTLTAAQ